MEETQFGWMDPVMVLSESRSVISFSWVPFMYCSIPLSASDTISLCGWVLHSDGRFSHVKTSSGSRMEVKLWSLGEIDDLRWGVDTGVSWLHGSIGNGQAGPEDVTQSLGECLAISGWDLKQSNYCMSRTGFFSSSEGIPLWELGHGVRCRQVEGAPACQS